MGVNPQDAQDVARWRKATERKVKTQQSLERLLLNGDDDVLLTCVKSQMPECNLNLPTCQIV